MELAMKAAFKGSSDRVHAAVGREGALGGERVTAQLHLEPGDVSIHTCHGTCCEPTSEAYKTGWLIRLDGSSDRVHDAVGREGAL